MTLAATIPVFVGASDWGAIAPELVLAGAVLVMLLMDAFLPQQSQIQMTTYAALAAVFVSFAFAWYLWDHGTSFAFYGTVSSDRFAIFFDYVVLLCALLAILLSPSYIETSAFDAGEYYALLLASATGMMLIAAAQSFMVVFIALEILSLALYILAGFERSRERSQEAGFKYFLLSSFASAFLIYGMALIYGATGSTRLPVINLCLHGVGCSPAAVNSPLLFIGVGLMAVGFAFKVSLVPFHMWVPDVYEGAPTPITAFMSVATKAAVFAAFVRVFNFSLSAVESHWFGLLWALSIATMIVGNLLALVQTNMKRLLAYSGIAHAGYVLVAMAANNPAGITAVEFYFLAYAFMNIGAFILVTVLESRGMVGDDIESYRGLSSRNPTLAAGTAVFMFSLAGFPPTAGFFAKYLAFIAVVNAGHTELAIVGVLTSLISVYYYLRVVYLMYFVRPQVEPGGAAVDGEVAAIPPTADIALAATVVGSIALGILPTGFFNLATQGVDAIRAAFGLP
jgi:NADH-quinone oxidoreductase subunit N